jgi:hypothetical protein
MSIVSGFVSEAASSQVVVKLTDNAVLKKLTDFGFGVVSNGIPTILSITVSDENAKARTLSMLRDERLCFSAGPNWCPADVFEYLRDQGMLSGPYRRIAWHGPGSPVITEDC